MLAKWIDAGSVAVTPQSPDDILSLRRAIRPGDTVSGRTTWVLKRDGPHARPDKGERVGVSVAVTVGRISLDNVLDRLRVGGAVCDSDNEAVPRGVQHSILVGVGRRIRVSKGRWLPAERRLLRHRTDRGFVLAAIDRTECGLARLSGTHIRHTPNLYSGWGGKRYRTTFDAARYMERVAGAADALAGRGDTLVVFGPGETKRRLANHMGRRGTAYPVLVADGVDTAGQDGIYQFARSDSLRSVMSGSRMALALSMVDEIMAMVGRGSARFTMGFADTRDAVARGAAESLAYSEGVFAGRDEGDVVRLLNDAERIGASVYGVDSSTDLGLRVTRLGGVVSTLRYAAG